MWGQDRSPGGPLQAPPLLALLALAVLPVGELAPAGAVEMSEVRGPMLLVAQPENDRLQFVRNASSRPLTMARAECELQPSNDDKK